MVRKFVTRLSNLSTIINNKVKPRNIVTFSIGIPNFYKIKEICVALCLSDWRNRRKQCNGSFKVTRFDCTIHSIVFNYSESTHSRPVAWADLHIFISRTCNAARRFFSTSQIPGWFEVFPFDVNPVCSSQSADVIPIVRSNSYAAHASPEFFSLHVRVCSRGISYKVFFYYIFRISRADIIQFLSAACAI